MKRSIALVILFLISFCASAQITPEGVQLMKNFPMCARVGITLADAIKLRDANVPKSEAIRWIKLVKNIPEGVRHKIIYNAYDNPEFFDTVPNEEFSKGFAIWCATNS